MKFFHNPRCSKSRQTLELLTEQGIKPAIVEYLITPPSKEELQSILDKLGITPRALMRQGQAEYKDNNLNDPALSNEQLIQAMVDNPILIERPILITKNKAAIGRPPKLVLDIL